jgi:hypothetical protein
VRVPCRRVDDRGGVDYSPWSPTAERRIGVVSLRSSLEHSRRAQSFLVQHITQSAAGLYPRLLTERVIAGPRPSFLLGEGLHARQNVQGAAPQSAKPLQCSNQKIPTQKGRKSVTWPLPNGASFKKSD